MPCPNDHRRRSVTIGFRVSPDEARHIDQLVRLSGMTKQDYIVKRLECEDVTVVPNVRVYKALRNEMRLVHRELSRIVAGGSPDPRTIELAEMLAHEFVALRGDVPADEIDEERAMLMAMERGAAGRTRR